MMQLLAITAISGRLPPSAEAYPGGCGCGCACKGAARHGAVEATVRVSRSMAPEPCIRPRVGGMHVQHRWACCSASGGGMWDATPHAWSAPHRCRKARVAGRPLPGLECWHSMALLLKHVMTPAA
jgi:hypothetical protein